MQLVLVDRVYSPIALIGLSTHRSADLSVDRAVGLQTGAAGAVGTGKRLEELLICITTGQSADYSVFD